MKGGKSQEHTSERINYRSVSVTTAPTRCADADAPSPNLTTDTLPEMLCHRVATTLDQGIVRPEKLFEFSAEEAILKTLVK